MHQKLIGNFYNFFVKEDFAAITGTFIDRKRPLCNDGFLVSIISIFITFMIERSNHFDIGSIEKNGRKNGW